MTDIVDRLRELTAGDIGDDGLDAIDEAAAEIERLREVADQRRDELDSMRVELWRLREALKRMRAECAEHLLTIERREIAILSAFEEIERLREALSFYANKAALENVRAVEHGITRYEQCQACDDAGHTARTALNQPRREE